MIKVYQLGILGSQLNKQTKQLLTVIAVLFFSMVISFVIFLLLVVSSRASDDCLLGATEAENDCFDNDMTLGNCHCIQYMEEWLFDRCATSHC